jgi:hypothetical protein
VQLPPSHPVDRPVLQPLMLLCLVVGAGLALFHGVEHESFLLDALTVVAFACFVVLFGVYWLGWLLREHDLWREGRKRQSE